MMSQEKAEQLAGQLARLTYQAAAIAAIKYMEQHHVPHPPVAKLADRINHHVAGMLPEMLEDYHNARQCGMEAAADLTARASIVLAGIEAAKDIEREHKAGVV